MELVAASVASGFLLAGLAAVMMIGQQVAYTPSAAAHRTDAAEVINQLSEELRYATLVIEQTPEILEFVVTDRNNDGTAETIRYEWSGTPGDPLFKTINSAVAVAVLDSLHAFEATLLFEPKTQTLTTTTDSAETVLASNTAVQGTTRRSITAIDQTAQRIDPASFSAVPADVIAFNATKVDYYGQTIAPLDDTVVVQLRSSSSQPEQPISQVLGEAAVAESLLNVAATWHTATFPQPVRGLPLHRKYNLVWGGLGSGIAFRLSYYDGATGGVLETSDNGASWQFITSRQVFYRLYGTYTTPGAAYNVTRNYVSNVRLVMQAGEQAHSRIDATIPLIGSPELLAAHWRADFDANPTSQNANGDAIADWAMAGGGALADSSLINGVWFSSGALETRPPSDFTTATTVEARCRNTGTGGNGAVVRINADRQGGTYAPLLVYVQRQADGTQTLALFGKTSDAATKLLFKRLKLPTDFIRFRLTVLPQYNVVNLAINDEDQGTFTYPTYAPATGSDRYLTLYADASSAEFDYIDVRSATP
jgi:hypothetical protein